MALSSATYGGIGNLTSTQGYGSKYGELSAADAFTMTQTTETDCSIAIPSAVLTNVVLSEGDIMMLDVEMKAVALTSGNVITFNLA